MKPKKLSYGGVLIDAQGRVLLRWPRGNFGGDGWTFAKGRPEAGESPEASAVREVLEETGWTAEIIAPIPGALEGDTTINRYWLMRPLERVGTNLAETERLRWCTQDQARELITSKPSSTKRHRDLTVLDAAFALHRERP